MKKRRGNKKLLSLPYIILFVLALASFTIFHGSFGIDVFQANRGVMARVASNHNAFVGIIYDEVYEVVYSDDSNYITMCIKNNLPYRVEYELGLYGEPIKDFSPRRFELYPNEKQLIEIQMLDLEEANEGIFGICGYISAKFDYGSVDAEFQFDVNIELPEQELVEIEGLHEDIQVITEDVLEENENEIKENEFDSIDIKNSDENEGNSNEKQGEMETINHENLPGETEHNSDSNKPMTDSIEEIDADNAKDEITESTLQNIIESDDILESNTESIKIDKAKDENK